jgi:hypothetical protein
MAKYDVFMSYARSDARLARSLTEALSEKGVKVWYDDEEIRVGDDFMRNIQDALKQSRFFLLIISPEYLSSQWGSFELGVALGHDAASEERHILPVFVRGAEGLPLPRTIRKYESLDADHTPVQQIAERVAEVVKKDNVIAK